METRKKTGPTPKREAQRRARRRTIPMAERLKWLNIIYGYRGSEGGENDGAQN